MMGKYLMAAAGRRQVFKDKFTQLVVPNTYAGTQYSIAFSRREKFGRMLMVVGNAKGAVMYTVDSRDDKIYGGDEAYSYFPGVSSGVRDIAFSQDDVYMALAVWASPYFAWYKVDGFDALKLTNPTSMPTDSCGVVLMRNAVSTLGQVIMGATSTPYIRTYNRSGETLTARSNVITQPSHWPIGGDLSPSDDIMAMVSTESPYLHLYKGPPSFATKLPNPSTLPTGGSRGAAFSPDGEHLAIVHSIAPFLTIYKRSGDVFTKIANFYIFGIDKLTATGWSVAYSPNGRWLAVGTANTADGGLHVFRRGGDQYAKLDIPDKITATVQGVAFSSDSKYLGAVAYGITKVYKCE